MHHFNVIDLLFFFLVIVILIAMGVIMDALALAVSRLEAQSALIVDYINALKASSIDATAIQDFAARVNAQSDKLAALLPQPQA